MGMKTPCLGAHSGSLKKTLVARTHNLGAPGARAPVRQQPWANLHFTLKTQGIETGYVSPPPNARGLAWEGGGGRWALLEVTEALQYMYCNSIQSHIL